MLSIILNSFFVLSAVAQTSYTITCGAFPSVVEVRSTWGALCKASAFDGGAAKTVPFSVFGLRVSGGNGDIVNVNPLGIDKNTFDFQISVKSATGQFEIENDVGVAPIAITVVDLPTNSSTMVCDTVLNVTSQVKCTITPRDVAGIPIWSEARIFTMFGIDIGTARGGIITWTSITPAVGNVFQVRGTFPYSSVFGVNNGVTQGLVNTAALDIPDGTTTLTCVPAVLLVSTSARCNIVAMKAGLPIVTPSSSFVVSGGNTGTTFGHVGPDGSAFVNLGTAFSFDVNVGPTSLAPFANTGIFPLSNGVSARDFNLTIVADPDLTSTLTCEQNKAVAGGQLRCTSTPKILNTNIWCETAVWVLAVEDRNGMMNLGSFSTILPTPAGHAFNWSLTANAIQPNHTFPFDITLTDGRSTKFELQMVAPEQPDSTSNMTCAPLSLTVGDTTYCTIWATKMGVPVVAVANAFSLSDAANGGVFSPLSPLSGTQFTFSYAPVGQGTILLSNGRSTSTVELIVAPAVPTPAPTSLPTSSPSITPPTPAGFTFAPSKAPSPAAPSTPLPPSSPTAPTNSPPTSPPGTPTTPKPPTAAAPTPVRTPTAPTAKAPTAAQVVEDADEGGLGAGGVIVIIIAVLLLGAGGWLLYRRYRKNKVKHFNIIDSDEMGSYEPARI